MNWFCRARHALVGVFVLGAMSQGACKNQAQCTAACESELEISGAFEVPSDASDLTIELCHDGACFTSKLVVEGGIGGNASDLGVVCVGAVDCEFVSGGVTLHIAQVTSEPQPGDEVTVKVKRGSGETLLDVNETIEQVTKNNICGNVCASATLNW